jgi:hypothetical protein
MTCYLCRSPVEKSPDGIAVFVECDNSEEQHVVCSMCTAVLKEARYRLKSNGKVIIKRSSEGIISIDA